MKSFTAAQRHLAPPLARLTALLVVSFFREADSLAGPSCVALAWAVGTPDATVLPIGPISRAVAPRPSR